jgi:hypothetical protein
MSDLMKVGSDWGGAGTFKPFTSSISGAQRVSDAHGRFMDAALSGRLYTGGMVGTSISNATFTTATTGATATPIIGLWNPTTSTANLIVLQAFLDVYMTALQATGVGGMAWMGCVGNSAITTGSDPINARTLVATGSQAKFFAGTALTGMTGTLAIIRGSGLSGGSAVTAAFLATQAGAQTQLPSGSIEVIDGSLIVPPGGVIGLFAAATGVGHSATSGIIWEETPLLITV